jgi:chromosome segregation ATPase
MAKPDKLKKRIKRLKRKLDQQSSLHEEIQKEIKHLKRELKVRDQSITDLQRQVSDRQDAVPALTDSILPADIKGTKLAIEHKAAWKKHKFLCERYDVHLDSGCDKDRARAMANEDLVDRHGKKAGFTVEQLCDILS